MEERTFQDWLDGKYGLYSSDNFFPNDKGENVNIPEDMPEVYKRELRKNNVIWEEKNRKNLVYDHELLPEVLACINAEKEKIFKAQIQNKLDELTSDFLSTTKDEKYQQDEIHDVKVMLGLREKELREDVLETNLLNRTLPESIDIAGIREYYISVLKPNKLAQYGFIHSPNFEYQDKSKIPSQVMATALFEYLKWLEKFDHKKYNKAQASKNRKDFSSPQIAIAMFALSEKMSYNAIEYWMLKYSNNKSVKGIMDKKIKDKNELISKAPDLRAYNKMLFNLECAIELLKLEGHSPQAKKLHSIINEFKEINSRFSKKQILF